MKRRTATLPAHPMRCADRPDTKQAGAPAQLGSADGQTRSGSNENGPLIVLSCAYSGANYVQAALAAGTDLACTSGTGIIPLCAAAAKTWQRAEGRDAQPISRLAAATIRNLVTAQTTTLLARTGKTQWCELSTTTPTAAQQFLQVFPQTIFICVHRRCLDVIRAGVQANPWGLQVPGLTPYLLTYPGNNVAALTAYWANSAEQLLAFEETNKCITHRIRYEDVTGHPDHALTTVKAFLRIKDRGPYTTFSSPSSFPPPDFTPATTDANVPLEMIPGPLRKRITDLENQLGYPPSVS